MFEKVSKKVSVIRSQFNHLLGIVIDNHLAVIRVNDAKKG